MRTIGFLHTSPVHVATFRRLVEELTPPGMDVTVVDAVDEALLELARVVGDRDVEVRAGIRSRLIELAGEGATQIVCTCSTIGGAAEEVGAEFGMRVVRVDRPMAEAAVALAARGRGRIAVVAGIESTVGPTRALLAEAAAAAGTASVVDVHLVDGAWARFEAGDLHGYLDAIADALPAIAAGADVVVLAQASMASVVGRVDVGVPVLASPTLAVQSVLG